MQIVLVRDPTHKRRDEAFFCTDLATDARFILEAYARRWCLEVTFHDAKQFLGFAEPQCQTPRAVQRTAPFALLVYDLVLLWFAEHAHAATHPQEDAMFRLDLANPAEVEAFLDDRRADVRATRVVAVGDGIQRAPGGNGRCRQRARREVANAGEEACREAATDLGRDVAVGMLKEDRGPVATEQDHRMVDQAGEDAIEVQPAADVTGDSTQRLGAME